MKFPAEIIENIESRPVHDGQAFLRINARKQRMDTVLISL